MTPTRQPETRRTLHRFVARARRASPVVSRRSHDELARLYKTWFPVGHFYSPYPDVRDVEARADTLLDPRAEVAGIDMRDDDQLALFESIAAIGADMPFAAHPDGRHRYHLANDTYAWADGIVLHALLRHLRPRRVIEVGSGHSSALILDTAEGWLDGDDHRVQLRFVEPHPGLLHSLLRPDDEDRVTVDDRAVQDVPLEVFDELGPGDVLFVDSTHVAKAGSDVNHLFFQVLPRLRAGVWVHLHDIFMPFEYPLDWVREGRAWHEAYLLRAFLMYNLVFEVRWFQHYMWTRHQQVLESRLPAMAESPGGNIWLQKTGGP
jgi:hypothetical protein